MKPRTILLIAAVLAATGGWYAFRPERLFIDSRVDEAAETGVAAAVIARGSFHGVAHESRGTAIAVRRADGSRFLRLTDFETSTRSRPRWTSTGTGRSRCGVAASR